MSREMIMVVVLSAVLTGGCDDGSEVGPPTRDAAASTARDAAASAALPEHLRGAYLCMEGLNDVGTAAIGSCDEGAVCVVEWGERVGSLPCSGEPDGGFCRRCPEGAARLGSSVEACRSFTKRCVSVPASC